MKCTWPSLILTSETDTSRDGLGASAGAVSLPWAASVGLCGIFWYKCRPVDHAVARPSHEYLGRGQRDAAKRELAHEDLHRIHRHIESRKIQQGLAVQFGEREFLQTDFARHQQDRGLVLCAGKGCRQLRREMSRRHSEIELRRDVFHVSSDIQPRDVDVDSCFQGFLERLGAPVQREGRAVDPRRKGWLDVVFQQIVEVRQEWNGDIDFRHRMAGMLGAVVEFQSATDELDVVQRKARRRLRFLFLFLGRLRGGRELLQQVREVVGRAVVVAHDANIGISESNLSQDGGTLVDGLSLKVQEQLAEGDEHLRTAALLDRETLDQHGQRERIDFDVVDGDLSMQLLAEAFHQVVFGDRRYHEKSDDREQHDQACDP